MRLSRLLPATLSVLLGVAGALVSVGSARVEAPDVVPANELAVAVVVTAYGGVALLVSIVQPRNRVGYLMVLGAAAWGVGEGLLALGIHEHSTTAGSWLISLGATSRALGWLVLVLAVPFTFPDGRPPWPRRRAPGIVVGLAIGLFTSAVFLAPIPLDRRAGQVDSPTGLPPRMQVFADALALSALALCVVALVVSIGALVHRWRTGDTLRQQQLLWLALAFVPPVLFLPLIATEIAQPWVFALVTLPVPLAIAVAILQRRLYDVQWAVSATLTYLALSAVICGLYVATVAGVGAVLEDRGASWLPWLAAGVVAVSFAPIRNALQQAVSRLAYGHWSQPAEVLGATARRLADASDVPALLSSLAIELSHTLRLRRVEIRDRHGHVLAAHGADDVSLTEHRLTAFGAPVGTLLWASGHDLRDGDRRLLNDVASQLGGVVHAAGLIDTLRAAQHRLVLAREEERRRLRRDLHDGLGPTLASLTLKVDELRNRWDRLEDPDTELLDLRASTQTAVADVRRIVEGLRPAPLDQLGLAGALEQLAMRASDTEVDVVVGELPPLPAAVEVAAFHVVREALSNAVKHAHADRIVVEVETVGDRLRAEIRDDGNGTVSPRQDGVGLASMRERAEELGGVFVIHGNPTRGTTVRLELPIAGSAAAKVGRP